MNEIYNSIILRKSDYKSIDAPITEINILDNSNKNVVYQTSIEVAEKLKDKQCQNIFANATLAVTSFLLEEVKVENPHCLTLMMNLLNKNPIDYQSLDVYYQKALFFELTKELKEKNLFNIYEDERAVIPSIAMMNVNGMKFRYEEWNSFLDSDRNEIEEMSKKLEESLVLKDIDFNQPKDLIFAIFKITNIKLRSLSMEELSKYEDNLIISLLLRLRKKINKVNIYGKKLKEAIYEDSRLRANWYLLGSITGRLIAKKPPITALPNEAKQFVVASEGNKFIIFDYSMIELRMIASLSKDIVLKNLFENNVDIHRITASKLLNIPIEEVTKDQRKMGKSLGFSIIYGVGKDSIQKNLLKLGLEFTLDECENFRIKFLNSYPELKQFQQLLLNAKVIMSVRGRQWQTKNLTPTQRINYPIQASISEGFKIALSKVQSKLQEDWKLIATVFDEAIYEVPEEEAVIAEEIIKKELIEGMSIVIDDIPVEIESKISDVWSK